MIEIIGTVLFLALLEGLLSFDNALALAAMVKHLPECQRKKALTYGMIGAFGFRLLALCFVTYIIANPWIKTVGAVYLIYLAVSHFIKSDEGQGIKVHTGRFIKTVIMVELTDIAFSIDSIITAVGVSKNLYVVIAGGIIGIIMMRFAATVFIKLIDKFPRLETSAFILVGIVGAKLIIETCCGIDFHDQLTAQALFWSAMLLGLLYGFTENHKQQGSI